VAPPIPLATGGRRRQLLAWGAALFQLQNDPAQEVIISADRVSISTRCPDRAPLRRAQCHRQALLLFLACCMVGCDDSTSPAACAATSAVVSVSGGLNPTITWAAECGAQEVAVYDVRTGFDMWHLTANARSIPKPVVYGVVPAGAKVLHSAEALQPGMGYGVYVAILVGTDTLASVTNFTP
jgi:hypothetical protein